MKLRSASKRKRFQRAAARKSSRRESATEMMALENELTMHQEQPQREHTKKTSVNFSMKVGNSLTDCSFYDFEQSPECSTLLYHINSGHNKFAAVNDLLKEDSPAEKKNMLKQLVREEIEDEMLTEAEKCDIIESFCEAQGRSHLIRGCESLIDEMPGLPPSSVVRHLTCGACGVKSVQGQQGRECTLVALRDLPSVMELNKQQQEDHLKLKKCKPCMLPVNVEGDLEPFYPHKIRSIYESCSLRKMFHLHPEFVHVHVDSETDKDEEMTVLCHNCSKWLNKRNGDRATEAPPNSIAAGIDFGNSKRVGLADPTMTEMMVIARIRHFHNVIKVQHNHTPGGRSDFTKSKLRAHSIAFKHDAPIVASIALMFQKFKAISELKPKVSKRSDNMRDDVAENLTGVLQSLLTIQLVGPDGGQDVLCKRTKKQQVLQVRPHVVWQWLSILQLCHASYKNDPQLQTVTDYVSFRKVIKTVEENVFDGAMSVNSKNALVSELITGDDVANVRSGILQKHDMSVVEESQPNDPCSHQMSMSHSLVSDSSPLQKKLSEALTDNDNMAECLAEIADAFNVEVPNKEDEDFIDWVTHREEDPVNEFEDMHELLVSAFPSVFMLGKSYPKKSLLDPHQMEHLLLQHTHAAATNKELLFYLFDCKSRHRVIKNLAAKVRKNPTAFNDYAKLVTSQKFREQVCKAAADPSSDAAKSVMRMVLPVLAFGSRNSTVSNIAGDTTMHAHGMAMAKRYGPNTSLVTVTPDDVNNPTSFRFSLIAPDNKSFPATAHDDFFDKLQSGQKVSQGNVKIPTDYTRRFKAASGNPVAVALEFRAMMENVVQILIGCPLNFQPGTNSGQKRTWYFKSKAKNSPHQKGIFGHVIAYFGCVETQARGALHFHIVIWGGITPHLLEKAASFPDICASIEKALDSMLIAHIPRSVHVKDILAQKMKETSFGRANLPTFAKIYPTMKHVPSPRMQKKWLHDFWDNTLRTGIHKHTFTCKQPPAGIHRCRGARPAGNCSATLPVMLEVPPEVWTMSINKKTSRSLAQITPTVSSKPIPVAPDPSQRNVFHQPFPLPCKELIVWELKRPLLDPLPCLPVKLQKAWKDVQRNEHGPRFSEHFCVEVSETCTEGKQFDTLMEAKEFCMKNIMECLRENSSATDSNAIEAFLKWFDELDPVQVLTIYDDLSDQICQRNGMVTETNPILSHVTGASTNAILIGNTQQASAALFYVLPYLCKSKFALEACLVALENAQRHVEEFPSVAKNVGTNTRTVQHMFTKVLNDLSRSVEMSDTQVALDLLNTGSEFTSDSYHYFGADFSVNHFHAQCATSFQCAEKTCFQDTVEEDDVNDDEDEDDDNETEEGQTLCNMDPDTLPVDGCRNKSFGPAPFYKTVRTGQAPASLPVHYPTHWWFRGKELRKLTQMEYAAIVSIQRISTDISDEAISNKRGRKKRTTFLFHPNHPLHGSHCQVLRVKQPTLIFNAHPPKFPGEPPKEPNEDATQREMDDFEEEHQTWSKAAQKFANYYEICFLPHTDLYGEKQPHHAITWETFCSKIQAMESSEFMIDKLRLDAMMTFILGFHSDYRKRIMFSNFRHRNTTQWTDMERKEATKVFAALGLRKRSFINEEDVEAMIEGKLTTEYFSPLKVKQFRSEHNFCRHQSRCLSKLFAVDAKRSGSQQNLNSVSAVDALEAKHRSVLHMGPDEPTDDIVQCIRLAQMDFETGTARQDLCPTEHMNTNNIKVAVQRYLLQRNLSDSQLKIVNRILQCFWCLKKNGKPLRECKGLNAPQLLVTGDPGSGKSYVIETIRTLASLMHVGHVATCSYNGIAAVNIDGTTICNLFKINDHTSSGRHWELDDDGLLELKQKLCADILCGVIVDEASTIDTRIIALLHHRLQQLMNNFDLPFGGVPIFFFGDFNQLGPVKKTFIPKDMMTWALRKHQLRRKQKQETGLVKEHRLGKRKRSVPQKICPSLFRKNLKQKLEMSKQDTQGESKKEAAANRFKPGTLPHQGCTLFANFERFHLMEQQRSCDPLHSEFVQKLSEGKPIDLTDILKYKHLSKQDIEKNPDDWTFAPVLVSTNRERLSIARMKAQLWARENNTYVFKWHTRTGKQVNRPSLDKFSDIQEHNAFFWQFFVAGAPSYLSHNINPDLALVNGTPLRAHSITFSTLEELQRIQELLEGPNAPPYGSEIEIKEPLSVNFVVLPSLDDKPVSEVRKCQLAALQKLTEAMPTNDDNEIVIPLTTNMQPGMNSDWDEFSYFTNNLLTPIATARVRNPFPFDLGFAMTVHKAQGRTIRRVVLDLTEHSNHYTKMKFAAVFVAMSRVASREHIRLLGHTKLGTQFDANQAYHYLTTLKAENDALAFYHGHEQLTNGTGRTKFLGMHWNATLALSHKAK